MESMEENEGKGTAAKRRWLRLTLAEWLAIAAIAAVLGAELITASKHSHCPAEPPEAC